MSRPATGSAALVVLLALAGWFVDLGAGAPARVQAIACTRAVLLDERLRCDDEVPATLSELCGAPVPGDRAIVSGDRIDVARACAGDATALARMSATDLRTLAIPIDVNHASADELRSVPGIGPVLAERVIAGRPYASVDDLDRVRGIGPKLLARLRTRVRAE